MICSNCKKELPKEGPRYFISEYGKDEVCESCHAEYWREYEEVYPGDYLNDDIFFRDFRD